MVVAQLLLTFVVCPFLSFLLPSHQLDVTMYGVPFHNQWIGIESVSLYTSEHNDQLQGT
jgi:hypothetical protein